MDWQIGFTLGLIVVALAAMIRELAAPDLILMAVLIAFGATGILSPVETFQGFANPVVAAVGALFMVSAALRETGALDMTLGRALGNSTHLRTGMVRMATPVAALSAFLNNAPIVAMMTPTVIDWARRLSLPPSRFLIPLSYASILGSINTIIGTSTILTIAGMVAAAGMEPMGFFELAPVGLPITAVGLVYLIAIAPRWLPDYSEASEDLGERRREYTASMSVQSDCPLISKTVEEAGLRNLAGLFLVEIDQGERVITPVAPDQIIREGDILVFAGVVSTIIDLQKIRGLVPIAHQEEPDGGPRGLHRRLVEAVVSTSSPLVGSSVRESNFRSAYDAVVIAVHRNGERVAGKIGQIVLRPGDTLLMQCAPDFMTRHEDSSDFYLVSELPDTEARRFDRAGTALAILGAMVFATTIGGLHISVAAFCAVGMLVATRCLTATQARRSVNWSVLIVIGAGLGIAGALQKTGAADFVAHALISGLGDTGPTVILIALYALCVLMAETLQHNAAVAIMFPIAVATANQLGLDTRPFVMTVAIGSACAFASPVSYQTHLIVYGPGGYRFTDFIRVGLPLDIVCGAIAITLIPWIWPLS